LLFDELSKSSNSDSVSQGKFGCKFFIFNFDEILNSFNIVNSAINSIIVFVWVNKKLTNTSISKHSKIVKFSFLFLFLHYLLYICLTYLPENSFVDIGNKFFILPNYQKEDMFVYGTFGGYIKLILISINVFNQIFLLNFHFIVIRQIILTQDHTRMFQGKK
jgi:hypothetical protein